MVKKRNQQEQTDNINQQEEPTKSNETHLNDGASETGEIPVSSVNSKESTSVEHLDDYICDSCGAKFNNEKSLQGHSLGAHGISLKTKDKAKSRKASTKRKPKPSQKGKKGKKEHYVAPDELIQLDEVLLDYNVDSRAGVIRSMSYRDPTDLMEVYRVLCDINVARARIKRIIKDYARRLDIPVPNEVVDLIEPPIRRDSFNRPMYNQEGEGEELQDEVIADIEKGRVYSSYRRQLDAETEAMKGYGKSDPEVTAMKQELKDLRDELAKERDQRLKDQINDLKKQIEEKGKNGDGWDKSILMAKRLGDRFEPYLKKYVNILTMGVEDAMGDLEPAPERERMEGSNLIYEMVPETMIEKTSPKVILEAVKDEKETK